MAKTRSLIRFAPRPAAPVIVMAPRRGGRIRRAASRAGHHLRRGGRAAAHHGRKALPFVGLALGGAVLGYADGKGWLNKLPAVGGSRALPIAAAGYLVTKMVRNPTARMIGAAMVVTGAFDWARTQGSSTHGIFGVADGGAGAGGGY
jgi:hypothetical protein